MSDGKPGAAQGSSCGALTRLVNGWLQSRIDELMPWHRADTQIHRKRYPIQRGIGPPLTHDLITSPAFIVVGAAEAFHTKITAPNQIWQTDFT
jgi:hypothetical protein